MLGGGKVRNDSHALTNLNELSSEYFKVKITRHTLQGVLGIARTTLVVGSTQLTSWFIVIPASMLINNFPANASLIPGSVRIA